MALTEIGLIVSNEEFLKDCQDVDTHFQNLIKELNLLEYNVRKITIISSNVKAIEIELESMMRALDIVILIGRKCSGFYRIICKLSNQDIKQNDELEAIYKENNISIDNEECFIPIQAKIWYNGGFPVVHYQRVFVVNQKCLSLSLSKELKIHLAQYRKNYIFEKIIKVPKNGNSNVDLSDVNKIADNGLKIEISTDDQCFIFTIQSHHLMPIVQLQNKIERKFAPYTMSHCFNPALWELIYSSTDEHIRFALDSIEKCLSDYNPQNVFISFNGGKDCTVLLHLVLTVMKTKYPNHTTPIFCLYVQSEDVFPEQDDFIYQCKLYYDLKIMSVKSDIKDALRRTLDEYPNYKACLMGTRRTDPYCGNLSTFQMTDTHWPQIMRVSPILDWHYSDIWDYLLYYKVPYCELYDKGFTSLGNTVNTTKNPSLMNFKTNEEEAYLPAYKLLIESKERNGRKSAS